MNPTDKLLRRQWKAIILQVACDMVGTICLAIAPLLQKQFFDEAIGKSFSFVVQIIGIYFILHIIYVLSQYFAMVYAFKSGVGYDKDLKKSFFSSLLRKSDAQFHKYNVAEYISIQANDITALGNDYLQPFIDIVRSVNMLVIYSIVLFVCIDWRIALAITLTSIIAIFVPKLVGKRLIDKRNHYQEVLAKYTVRITDFLEGFRLLNTRTKKPIQRVHNQALEDAAIARMAYGKEKSLVLCLGVLLTKLVKVCTFSLTAILFFKQEITIGIGVATLSYVSSFIDPIDSILYDITTIQSMKKVKNKVDCYLSDLEKEKIVAVPLKKGITFQHVYFSRDRFALKDLNFTIEKGKKYLLMGANGSGKSTILKMIMDYEQQEKGQIFL